MSRRRRSSDLTLRELDVARLLRDGLVNKEIAIELGISPRTVEIHRASMNAKTGGKTTLESILILIARDWIAPYRLVEEDDGKSQGANQRDFRQDPINGSIGYRC